MPPLRDIMQPPHWFRHHSQRVWLHRAELHPAAAHRIGQRVSGRRHCLVNSAAGDSAILRHFGGVPAIRIAVRTGSFWLAVSALQDQNPRSGNSVQFCPRKYRIPDWRLARDHRTPDSCVSPQLIRQLHRCILVELLPAFAALLRVSMERAIPLRN